MHATVTSSVLQAWPALYAIRERERPRTRAVWPISSKGGWGFRKLLLATPLSIRGFGRQLLILSSVAERIALRRYAKEAQCKIYIEITPNIYPDTCTTCRYMYYRYGKMSGSTSLVQSRRLYMKPLMGTGCIPPASIAGLSLFRHRWRYAFRHGFGSREDRDVKTTWYISGT